MNNDTFMYNCIFFVGVLLAILIAPSIEWRYREGLLLSCCLVSMLFWVFNGIQANELWTKYLNLRGLHKDNLSFIEKLYSRVLYLEHIVQKPPNLTEAEWKFILKQVHPDKHRNNKLAQSVTRKLLELRKNK